MEVSQYNSGKLAFKKAISRLPAPGNRCHDLSLFFLGGAPGIGATDRVSLHINKVSHE
jgi:hypothetical protein